MIRIRTPVLHRRKASSASLVSTLLYVLGEEKFNGAIWVRGQGGGPALPQAQRTQEQGRRLDPHSFWSVDPDPEV